VTAAVNGKHFKGVVSRYLCGTMMKMLHKMEGNKRLFSILFFPDRPRDILKESSSKADFTHTGINTNKVNKKLIR